MFFWASSVTLLYGPALQYAGHEAGYSRQLNAAVCMPLVTLWGQGTPGSGLLGDMTILRVWRLGAPAATATSRVRSSGASGRQVLRCVSSGPLLWLRSLCGCGASTPTEVRSPHIDCFLFCSAVCYHWGVMRMGTLCLLLPVCRLLGWQSAYMQALTVHLFVVVRLSSVCQGCGVSMQETYLMSQQARGRQV